ncbi:hypothetical protein BS47DRAFT_1367470 [Hydnum rufescens UP504]|uniref:Uncharacterized protein n=1 Tax=Hydnum rufescens UP504 TaxID=1448309 RepID=A0A9P6AI46_9AGAM|nr:hypothetical protein BS47DRAFT_1367470 [Hydnum rufescens UP504]
MASLKRLEDRLNPIDVGITMLTVDGIQLILECLDVGFLLVHSMRSFAWIHIKIAHVQFDLASHKLVLWSEGRIGKNIGLEQSNSTTSLRNTGAGAAVIGATAATTKVWLIVVVAIG